MKKLESGPGLVIPENLHAVRIKWDAGISSEMSVSAYLLAVNDKVRSDVDFVFYNQPQSEEGSVKLSGEGSRLVFLCGFN